jgi:hypothetical protein
VLNELEVLFNGRMPKTTSLHKSLLTFSITPEEVINIGCYEIEIKTILGGTISVGTFIVESS